MKLRMQVGLGPGHIVLDGDPAPSPKGHNPQFSAHICCGQTAGWIMMTFDMEVGHRPRRLCVRCGPSSPSPKRERCPQFSAHVYCGQTAGWIKMALGMELGLGLGYIVLDGNPAPLPKKGAEPPIFGPYLLWPNGCIYVSGYNLVRR